MGVVVLEKQGFIYQDDFQGDSLDSRWEVLPESGYVLNGSLTLVGGSGPTHLFFKELTSMNQFVLDLKNNYNPTAGGDTGGLIVLAGVDDYILLEEYFDVIEGTVNSYPWLRLVRDYNKYFAYWSTDGNTWNFIGSHDFDRFAPKIGLFLSGAASMECNLIRVFSSSKIRVNGLTQGTRVDLINEQGLSVASQVCMEGRSSVSVNLPTAPFVGGIRVTLHGGSVYSSTKVWEIWGGDEYRFSPSLSLYYVDEALQERLVEPDFEKFLGHLNSGSLGYRDLKLIFKNELASGSIHDTTVTLKQAGGTQHYLTHTKLAADEGGVAGELVGSLSLGVIPAGGAKVFWLRVYRDLTLPHIFFALDVISQSISAS